MELLAPAGSPEALTAAIQAGADAVYLGYGDLNARRNAKNFSQEELAAAVAYCHLRGRKVYLTLNTLLNNRELEAAQQTARLANDLGVDAVLVQDLGVAKLLRSTCPDLPLHASTQMTVHTLDGIKACADLGMERVVLSRELPKTVLADLCAKSPVELEVFAHGALCMCYSGQCYLSAVLGGRSGNRGLCAQPCRLAYRFPDDKTAGYPLSLKDLSLAGHLQELEQMGVACLKIEGRMKRPEYVSVVTGIYAAALREQREPTAEETRDLTAAFSRQGFTQGYYLDKKGAAMFGTRKEGDPTALFERVRQDYLHTEHGLVPISLAVSVRRDTPVTVTAWDSEGRVAKAEGALPQLAVKRAVTAEQLEAQLKKTGGTVYQADAVQAEVEEGLSVPLSAVNALRRAVLEALTAERQKPPRRRTMPFDLPHREKGTQEPVRFSVSLHKAEQLSRALLEQEPAFVYLPVGVWEKNQDLVSEYCKQYGQTKFGVSFPRVSWDRERPQVEKELAAASAAGATEALLGHIGWLPLAQAYGFTLRGDYGLGLVNDLTAHELKRLGFASATASFELRFAQMRDLSKPLPMEAFLYGRLPLMLMENCIMKNRDKGCHCQEKPQSLRDRKGEEFPVEQAFGCRNELYNAKVLWLADKKKDWSRLGLSYGRLSFLRESAKECAEILRAYRTGADTLPPDFTRGLYYRGVE